MDGQTDPSLRLQSEHLTSQSSGLALSIVSSWTLCLTPTAVTRVHRGTYTCQLRTIFWPLTQTMDHRELEQPELAEAPVIAHSVVGILVRSRWPVHCLWLSTPNRVSHRTARGEIITNRASSWARMWRVFHMKHTRRDNVCIFTELPLCLSSFPFLFFFCFQITKDVVQIFCCVISVWSTTFE